VPRNESPTAPREIRRYENRKLYDAAERRYVTLDQLRTRVAAGEEVEVLDQKTGEDLTTLTLAQVLLEGLRGSTARVPRQVLARLIRLSFGGPGHGRETPAAPQDAAAQARQEAERIVGGLLAKGRLTLEEGVALRQELSGAVHQIVAEAQAGLEGRLRALFGSAHDGPDTSLRGLKDRIEALSARVGTARGKTKPGRTKAMASVRPRSNRKH
jgi:polyhydroxyalkanoate synthesis repressor PhaR